MTASGKGKHNDAAYVAGFQILLGAGAGYAAGRLFKCGQHVRESKLAELNSAPTIPISSLKNHHIPKQGELVVIENGQVYPLSSVPAANYKSNQPRRYDDCGAELVVSKTRTHTNEPYEFKDLYNGASTEDVYRVPFALVEGKKFGRGSFVIVKNADTDHLTLEQKETKATPLDPPVKLTKTVVIDENSKSTTKEVVIDDENSKCETEKVVIDKNTKREMSTTIEVYKITEQSVLRSGKRMESVFGRLSTRNGMAEIEPCPNFRKACFTMRREEIKKMVSSNGEEILGVGLGLLSFGLICSGVYSYGSNMS